MKSSSNKKGFTLIELLVVIAIIAILTAIVTANFAGAKAKSRDAKRISDLAQIQLALEMVFDRCNAYPADVYQTADICTGYKMSNFISNIPKDNGINYEYNKNATEPYIDYVLRAKLETNSTALMDDVDGNVFNLSCGNTPDAIESDGRYYYCVQPK